MLPNQDLKHALRHVRWIGGGPDAGKTTVATALCEKYGWQLYSLDEEAERHWIDHISQDPDSFGVQWMKLSLDERWLQPPESQVEAILQITADDFPLVINDLLKRPQEEPVLVEGNLPAGLVEPLLQTTNQAIWMIPTATFAPDSFYRRGKHTFHQARSDPAQALANHLTRDKLFTAYVKADVQARGLPLLEVDGKQSLEEVVATVEKHFKQG